MNEDKVDFDDFAGDYRKLVSDQLGFFDADSAYFARYKVELTKTLIEPSVPPRRILDFGCGVGECIPWLLRVFEGSQVVGCDVSSRSLEIARSRYPEADFFDAESISDVERFDLIYSAGVFHHIAPVDRGDVLTDVARLLGRDGRFVVFEHNPYNPITRRVVSNCPFDADAVLLRPREWDALLSDAELKVLWREYTLFFPSFLSGFRPLERYLRWLPLGGQYCIVAARS